jgi:hypothetical protein
LGRGRGRSSYGSRNFYPEEPSFHRAPSERRINSLQKKKRSYDQPQNAAVVEARRASSVPRNSLQNQQTLMTTSLTGSSIWRPDGKCPSFADILKAGTSSNVDITEKQQQPTQQQQQQQHRQEPERGKNIEKEAATVNEEIVCVRKEKLVKKIHKEVSVIQEIGIPINEDISRVKEEKVGVTSSRQGILTEVQETRINESVISQEEESK